MVPTSLRARLVNTAPRIPPPLLLAPLASTAPTQRSPLAAWVEAGPMPQALSQQLSALRVKLASMASASGRPLRGVVALSTAQPVPTGIVRARLRPLLPASSASLADTVVAVPASQAALLVRTARQTPAASLRALLVATAATPAAAQTVLPAAGPTQLVLLHPRSV